MKSLILFILAIGFAQPASVYAQQLAVDEAPKKRQLIDITEHEAEVLISKLKVAQDRLEAGQFQSFRLLAGSIASYDQTKVSPRRAFLYIDFDDVWEVKHLPNATNIGHSFRLAYAPDGLGKLFWDIKVTTDTTERLNIVSMIYRPPEQF